MDIMAGASQLSDGTVSPQITFLGHSTLIIELDGVRLLTDPLLRDKVTFLQRNYPPLTSSDYAGCFDAVLISHMHYDHLDVRSLALLGKDVPLVTPRGGNRVLRPAGFQNVLEVGVGENLFAGRVGIRAVYADHDARRRPFSSIGRDSLGYVIDGSISVYFPGDTRLFPEIGRVNDTLDRGMDLALMPVWGWGYNIGKKHMGPREAAEALKLLKPRHAVPIHWGTYAPMGVKWLKPDYLHTPPVDFTRHAHELSPEVKVTTLLPGESLKFGVNHPTLAAARQPVL